MELSPSFYFAFSQQPFVNIYVLSLFNVSSRRTCWYWGKLWNPFWLSASSVYQTSTLQSKNR